MEKSTDYIGVRLSKALYDDFKIYCKSRELSITFAMKLFVDECIKNNYIPFTLGESIENNIKYSDSQARKSLYMSRNKRDKFQSICEDKFCLSMAGVIKAYMVYCIVHRPKLPYSFEKTV